MAGKISFSSTYRVSKTHPGQIGHGIEIKINLESQITHVFLPLYFKEHLNHLLRWSNNFVVDKALSSSSCKNFGKHFRSKKKDVCQVKFVSETLDLRKCVSLQRNLS